MKTFAFKFYARMLIFAGTFAALASLMLQTTFDRVTIEHDHSLLVWFLVLPVVFGTVTALFTLWMAVHNTNVLRRYEYSVRKEKVFYAVFAALLILIAAADLTFLLYKLFPMLDSAFAYALKDAQIKNETISMRQEIIDKLNTRYRNYKTASVTGAILSLIIQSVIYVLSAIKLVKEYRDPPDYWSGRKKGQKIKR